MWRKDTKKSKPLHFQSYTYMLSLHLLTHSFSFWRDSDIWREKNNRKKEISSCQVGLNCVPRSVFFFMCLNLIVYSIKETEEPRSVSADSA